MQLPLDLTNNSLSPMGANASAVSPNRAGNNDDGEALAGQFSNLLGQALNQQAATLTVTTAPENSTTLTVETASLVDNAVELPIVRIPGAKTEPAGEPEISSDHKSESGNGGNLLSGFPLNLLSTLQTWISPRPAAQPATPVESEQPAIQPESDIAQTPTASTSASSDVAAPQLSTTEMPVIQVPVPQAAKPGEILTKIALVSGTAGTNPTTPPPRQASTGTQVMMTKSDAPAAGDTTASQKISATAPDDAPFANPKKDTSRNNAPDTPAPANPASAAIVNPASMDAANQATANVNAIQPLLQSQAASGMPVPVVNVDNNESSQASGKSTSVSAIGDRPTPQPASSLPIALHPSLQTAAASTPKKATSAVLTDMPSANATLTQPDTLAPEPFTLPPSPVSETQAKGNPDLPATPDTPPLAVSDSAIQPAMANPNSQPASQNPAPSTDANLLNLAAPITATPIDASGKAKPTSMINALQSIQSNLRQMNGTVETPPGPAPVTTAPGTKQTWKVSDDESGLEQTSKTSADFGTTLDAADTAQPTAAPQDGLSGPDLPTLPTPAGASQSAPTAAADAPHFVSKAQHPTEQVLDGTVYSVKNGHKELVIRLNPDNLGEVRVSLVSHGNNEMSARLIASNPESHALLQDQAQSLKTSLEAQGIQVDRLTVVLAGSADLHGNLGHNPNNTQQDAQQQSFNQNHTAQQDFTQQQDQQTPNPFAQMAGGGFQQKSPFAQNPATSQYGNLPGSGELTSGDIPKTTEGRAPANDNGRISILA